MQMHIVLQLCRLIDKERVTIQMPNWSLRLILNFRKALDKTQSPSYDLTAS